MAVAESGNVPGPEYPRPTGTHLPARWLLKRPSAIRDASTKNVCASGPYSEIPENRGAARSADVRRENGRSDATDREGLRRRRISVYVYGPLAQRFVDASRIADGPFQQPSALNVFLLGVAYQGGHIPLSGPPSRGCHPPNGASASQPGGVLVGRKYYHDARIGEEFSIRPKPKEQRLPTAEHLARASWRDYQNAAYAELYLQFVRQVAAKAPALEEPVARYLTTDGLQDEYEVGRLLPSAASPAIGSDVAELNPWL